MPTNTDFRISVGFAHHHKTRKLMRRCGAAGVLALVYIWGHAAQNRPDGNLAGWTTEDFSIAGQWEGDPAQLMDALVGCGFVDGEPGAYRIHDWVDHNGFASKAALRSEAARANVSARWTKKNGYGGNTGVLPNGYGGNTGVLPSAPSGNTGVIPDVYDGNTPFLSFPIPTPTPKKKDVGDTGTSDKPTRHASLVDAGYLEALKTNPGYSGIDIEREYHRMLAWLETPRGRGKHPTKARFLSWLSRCEPIGGKPSAPVKDEWDLLLEKQDAERAERRRAAEAAAVEKAKATDA